MSSPNYPQHPPYGNAFNDPVPLWAPYYGASITIAVKRFFTKYATFSGRASRSEFWWWTLVSFLVTLLLSGGSQSGDGSTAVSLIGGLWGLAILIPSIALTVRRLHDSNKSGWLYLLNFLPIIGSMIVLILAVLPPNPDGRRYDRPDEWPRPTNNRGPALR